MLQLQHIVKEYVAVIYKFTILFDQTLMGLAELAKSSICYNIRKKNAGDFLLIFSHVSYWKKGL